MDNTELFKVALLAAALQQTPKLKFYVSIPADKIKAFYFDTESTFNKISDELLDLTDLYYGVDSFFNV